MKQILILCISLLPINNLFAQKYTETYIKDANKIGLEWWNKVNTEQYEKAYTNFADIYKSYVTIEKWLDQISMLMDEFGHFESRKVKDTYFQSEMEGLGDGFYVTVVYEVKYSKTRNHTESVLLKQNDKLEWQIIDFSYAFQNLETAE